MNNKISDKDKKDWENFLSDNENLPDKDESFEKKIINKVDSFDLHGYTLEEANRKISNLIFNSYNQNVNKLVIVTGKGLHSKNDKNPFVSKDYSILKYSVPEYIKNNEELMSMINEIKSAEIKDGGDGAFYIFLKKKPIK